MNGDQSPSWWADYVFIGFDGYSPEFLWGNGVYGLPSPYQYFHFCVLFYISLVQGGSSVINALDDASYQCSGCSFPYGWVGTMKPGFDPDGPLQLPPYDSQMKVLGNGDAHYPRYPW